MRRCSKNHALARTDIRRQNIMIAYEGMWQSHWCRYFDLSERHIWRLGKLEFVKRALRGERIHWARILWLVTRQHIDETMAGSAYHLFPFYLFLQKDGALECGRAEEVFDANACEGWKRHFGCQWNRYRPTCLAFGMADGSKDKGEEWPQKRWKLQEVPVLETLDHCAKMRVCRLVPIKLITANVRGRTKIKALRLIQVDGNSIKSSVIALQGRLISKEWAELEAHAIGMEEEWPSERGLRPSVLVESDAPKEAKVYEVEKEKGILRRNPVPSARAMASTSSENLEVLTMSLNR